jgi:hypothetical protein
MVAAAADGAGVDVVVGLACAWEAREEKEVARSGSGEREGDERQ